MTIYVEAFTVWKKSCRKVWIAPIGKRKFVLSFQKLRTNVKFDKLNKKFMLVLCLPSVLFTTNK